MMTNSTKESLKGSAQGAVGNMAELTPSGAGNSAIRDATKKATDSTAQSAAIIIASFGTSHDDARRSCIDALETHVSEHFTSFRVMPAFTSGMVRKILDKRGIRVPSPEEAMVRLAQEGTKRLAVLPTHVMAGYEYEKLRGAVRENAGLFEKTAVASPLLSTPEDIEALMQAVLEEYAVATGEGLVLMGHGTHHESNSVYQEINDYLHHLGRRNVFVGTVEAEPGLPHAIAAMRKQGVRRVTLAPLMFVAGDHAKNDMAGGEGSWLQSFEEAGFEVKTVLKGLGELLAVRRMYLEHLRDALSVL